MKKLTASILTAGLLFTGIANVQAAGNAYGHDKGKAQGKAVGHQKEAVTEAPVTEPVIEAPVEAPVVEEEGLKYGDDIQFVEWKGLQTWQYPNYIYSFRKDDGTYMSMRVGAAYNIGDGIFDLSINEAERLLNDQYDDYVFVKVQ